MEPDEFVPFFSGTSAPFFTTSQLFRAEIICVNFSPGKPDTRSPWHRREREIKFLGKISNLSAFLLPLLKYGGRKSAISIFLLERIVRIHPVEGSRRGSFTDLSQLRLLQLSLRGIKRRNDGCNNIEILFGNSSLFLQLPFPRNVHAHTHTRVCARYVNRKRKDSYLANR